MNRLFIPFLALLLLASNSDAFAQSKVKVQKDKLGDKNYFFQNKLNLTNEQKKMVESIKLKYETNLIDLNAELKKFKVEKKKLLAQSGFSKNEYFGIEENIINAETKIKLERNKIKSEIFDILDEEQRQKYLSGNNFFGFAFNDDLSLILDNLSFEGFPDFPEFDFNFDFDFKGKDKNKEETE